MLAEIFKWNKVIFFTAFGILLLMFSFGIIEQTVPTAKACEMECDQQASSCTYQPRILGSTSWACVINSSLGVGGTSNPSCLDTTNQSACKLDSCPTSFNTANGATCKILDSSMAGPGCGVDDPPNATGKWDASESKCVSCSSQKENRVYNIKNSGCVTGSQCLSDTAGNSKFETACSSSVDSACDDKNQGDNCGGTNTCDASGKCIAAPTCDPATATAPAITGISPNPYTGPTGSKSFTVNVTRGDPASCAADAVPILVACAPAVATVPGGSPTTSTPAVAPGGATTATFTITVNGTGSCTVMAYSPVNNARMTSATLNLTVSANALSVNPSPSSITASTPTPVTFTVSGGGSPALNVDVTLSTGQSCNTGGSGFCSITVNATSNVSITAHDPSNTYTDGTGTIAVTGGGGVTVASCSAGCNPSYTGGDCNGMVGSAILWTAATAPTDAASCAADTNIASMCSAEGSYASACSITLSNGTTCSCSGVPGPGPGPAPLTTCGGAGMFSNPIKYCKIQELIAGATNWVLGLVSGVIILILIIGGIMYITSAGDEEKIRMAKNTILYAIVGLAIVLLAYSLINEVKLILKIT